MSAASVVAFPVNVVTRDLLYCITGTERTRLAELASRLSGIEAMLFHLKNAETMPPTAQAVLAGLEDAVHGCLMVAELRPLARGDAA